MACLFFLNEGISGSHRAKTKTGDAMRRQWFSSLKPSVYDLPR